MKVYVNFILGIYEEPVGTPIVVDINEEKTQGNIGNLENIL